MTTISDENQYAPLSSPLDEGKRRDARSGGLKDDAKEQAFAAKEGIKARAAQLKEQVANSDAAHTIMDKVSGTLDSLRQKAGISQEQVDDAKSQASELKERGAAKARQIQKKGIREEEVQELADDVSQQAAEGWETVKRKGNRQAKQLGAQADAKLNEKLSPEQRAALDRNLRTAKAQAQRMERKAQGFSDRLILQLFSSPALRSTRNFIRRNRLQLPVVVLSFILTMWAGLGLIRMLTVSSKPSPPEFDIHSAENSAHWLKYWGGEYAGKAAEMQTSLAGRAAAFLANYEWDKVKDKLTLSEYRKIGVEKLGLREPTWTEWAMAKLTGRPLTWQSRVNNVLNLARAGIYRRDIVEKPGIVDRVKSMLRPNEPTLSEKAGDYIDSVLHRREPTLGEKAAGVWESLTTKPEPTLGEKAAGAAEALRDRIPGMAPAEPEGLVDGLKHKLADGYDSLRSNLPGSSAYAQAKQAAYDAAHPSTLDQLKSTANYVKNRVVHGAQEAKHNVQDRSNEAADKAKWKMGL